MLLHGSWDVNNSGDEDLAYFTDAEKYILKERKTFSKKNVALIAWFLEMSNIHNSFNHTYHTVKFF